VCRSWLVVCRVAATSVVDGISLRAQHLGAWPLFASSAAVSVVRHEFLRTAQEYAFAVVAYCFMPDHLHALVFGITPHSDFRLFMAAFRGRSSRVCRSACGVRVWQRGYYDRVLRDHDPSERVAAYIVHNPCVQGWPRNRERIHSRGPRTGRRTSASSSLADVQGSRSAGLCPAFHEPLSRDPASSTSPGESTAARSRA
jgi:putative transposase